MTLEKGWGIAVAATAAVTLAGWWAWRVIGSRRRKSPDELERLRRLEVNAHGRIIPGRIVELVEPGAGRTCRADSSIRLRGCRGHLRGGAGSERNAGNCRCRAVFAWPDHKREIRSQDSPPIPSLPAKSGAAFPSWISTGTHRPSAAKNPPNNPPQKAHSYRPYRQAKLSACSTMSRPFIAHRRGGQPLLSQRLYNQLSLSQ